MPQHNSNLTFGYYLKSTREKAGLDLEYISWQTKISLKMLEFIENEDHTKLPEPVYTKGFIRAYATAIGADADIAVQNYVESRLRYLEITQPNAGFSVKKEKKTYDLRPRRALGTSALISIILIIGLAVFFYQKRFGFESVEPTGPAEKVIEQKEVVPDPIKISEQSEPADQPPTVDSKDESMVSLEIEDKAESEQKDQIEGTDLSEQTEQPDEVAQSEQPDQLVQSEQTEEADRSIPIEQTDRSDPIDPSEEIDREAIGSLTGENAEETAVAAPEEKPDILKLSITANAETWIKIIIDAEKPLEYLLKPGDKIALNANSHYNLLIGNAGGVQMNLNGQPVQIPGKMGQVVNLTLP